jgi:hypothetical protein
VTAPESIAVLDLGEAGLEIARDLLIEMRDGQSQELR